MDNKTQLLEAILFMRGEEVSRKDLLELLKIDVVKLEEAVSALREALRGHGIAIIETATALALATAPEVSGAMKKIREEELSVALSKGALETLTIILYRAPIAKGDIDYLRGVNSATMLRNLSIRGLIERDEHPTDKRSFLYRPSIQLFSHLGITGKEALPEYTKFSSDIERAVRDVEEQKKT